MCLGLLLRRNIALAHDGLQFFSGLGQHLNRGVVHRAHVVAYGFLQTQQVSTSHSVCKAGFLQRGHCAVVLRVGLCHLVLKAGEHAVLAAGVVVNRFACSYVVFVRGVSVGRQITHHFLSLLGRHLQTSAQLRNASTGHRRGLLVLGLHVFFLLRGSAILGNERI